MKKKRIARILVALGIIISAWWIFYFPYSRTRLYRPIPVNAAFISEHIGLAGRWKETITNPVAVNMIRSVFGDVDLQKAAEMKRVGALVQMLSSKNTVFAHVPSFKYTGSPAWIISSWIGSDGKLMRSGILKKMIPNIEEKLFEGGRKGWAVTLDSKSPYGVMSMAVSEGILIICFSKNADDVEYLLNVAERGNQVSAQTAKKLSAFKGADRGWVSLISYGIRSFGPHEMFFSLSSLDKDSIEGWVGMDYAFDEGTRVVEKREYATVEKLTASSLEALIVLPWKNVTSYVAGLHPSNGLKKVVSSLEGHADPDGTLFFGLRSRKDEGRAMSLAAPSFVMGLEIQEGTNFIDTVPRLLDGINSGFEGSFIPRGTSIGEKPVMVVESTRPSTFAGFDGNQKPTFMAEGRWMILASNMVVLERLFGENPVGDKITLPPGLEKGTLAGAWADVPLMNYSLRDNALPILALIFGVNNSPDSKRNRRRVDSIDYFASFLEGAEDCRLWLEDEKEMARFHFEFSGHAE